MSSNPQLSTGTVHTLDLNFRARVGAIAVYLIPHSHGAALVECGPGSTLPVLQAALQEHGFTPADITDVLVTHIHLDHAGAAGWFARQGARIHVHPVGAPHLINPEKLLASAGRIYGDQMDILWGEFLPVPEERLNILEDNQEIQIGGPQGLRFRALDTPGHAYHHYAYILDDLCFTGDIGAVRVQGSYAISLPMPPPELNIELWRQSLSRLETEYARGAFQRVAPTHFGIFADPAWHLAEVRRSLDLVEAWLERVMPADPSADDVSRQFVEWSRRLAATSGADAATLSRIDAANPAWMSGQGLHRYWHKTRRPTS